MALRTLAGRREYVGTFRSYDRTISARLKDARMRCTAEMHVRGKNVKERLKDARMRCTAEMHVWVHK